MENSDINQHYLKQIPVNANIAIPPIDGFKQYNQDNSHLLNDIGKDFFLGDYNTEEWEEITPQTEHKVAFLGEQYLFKTEDGTIIKTEKDDNVRVKINKNTGEIAIIGARNAQVNIEGDTKVTVVESTVNTIVNKTGNAIISVRGAHSNVKKIVGGDGNQTVNVKDGALVEKIKTKGGDDVINVETGAVVGKVNTGDGNDTINVTDSNVKNNIKTGSGDDNINITKSSVNKKIITGDGADNIEIKDSSVAGNIKSGAGDDNVNVEGATISGKLKAGEGNDNININASKVDSTVKTGSGDDTVVIKDTTVSSKGKIKVEDGDDKLNIDNSQVNGKVKVSSSTSDVNVKDSIINKLDTDSRVESTDSAIGELKGEGNVSRHITSIDTNDGEFKGFEKITEVTDNNDSLIYTLPDGTTIETDKSGGEIYVNADTGAIVLNGINNAKINSNSSAKITAINSNILNQNDLAGEVEYRNSIVKDIKTNNEDNVTITGNRSNIKEIKSTGGNVNLNITNNANVGKVTAKGDDTINVQMDSGSLDKIHAKDNVSVNISAKSEKTNIDINKIITKNGFINADFKGANVNKIKASNGNLNLRATSGSYGIIINSSKNGTSNINLENSTSKKINTKNSSNINISGGNINSIKTGKADDTITLSNTTVKKVNAGKGSDAIEVNNSVVSKKITANDDENKIVINNSTVKAVKSNGETAIDNSQIKTADINGDIAIESSEINKLKSTEKDNNISVTDSIINRLNSIDDDNVYINNFGETTSYNDTETAKNNKAATVITELNEKENEELFVLLNSLAGNEISSLIAQNGNKLSKEEIINFVMQNPNENISKIKTMMLKEMEGALTTLKENNNDTNKTKGIYGHFTSDNKKEIEVKTSIYEKAVASDDFNSILNAYKLLVGEKADAQKLSETNEAIQFSQTLSDENINMIIDVLNIVANDLDYKTTEQDGIIKSGISQINNVYDIGTTQKEVEAYINTFRKDVAELKEKYNSGLLTKEDFAVEYKRLTGNAFNQGNVKTLLDNVRGNDKFDSTIKERIEQYQSTQNTVFQVGEYAVVLVSGAAVTLASGGAAGPAVAYALSTLGRMGIALTATTVSFVTKMAIEASERQTNATTDDDMTPEEVGRTAALMYAGCLAGQFGNYMGELVGEKFGAIASELISNKVLANATTFLVKEAADVTADTVLTIGFDYLITGKGEFNEEFVQNLKSEIIGLIQNKITNAYLKSHPEIQIKNELYRAAKKLGETAGYQAVLDRYGMNGFSADGLSMEEVATLIETNLAIGALGTDAVTRILTEDGETETKGQKSTETEEVKQQESAEQKPTEAEEVKQEETAEQKAVKPIGLEPIDTSKVKRTVETLSDGRTKETLSDLDGRVLAERLYDNSGKITQESRYRTDTTKPILDVVVEYENDGTSIKARKVYNSDSSYSSEEYSQGRLTRAVEYTSKGKVTGSYQLVYDAQGQVKQKDVYDAKGNFAGTKIYEYDSKGRVISETIQDKNNKTIRKIIKTYNADRSVKTQLELPDGTKVDTVDKAAVEALHAKIVQQQMIATQEDIENIIKELTQNGVTREEAITALEMMTQYSSMSQLVELATRLKSECGQLELYVSDEMGVSANAALNYIGAKKGHFGLSKGSDNGGIIILDEYAIKYLETLQQTNPTKFEEIKKKCKFATIDGWDAGFTMFNQDGNVSGLKQKTEAIISKAKALQASEGISFEEAVKQVMDNGASERIKKLGLEKAVKKIELKENGSSVETIVKNIEPMTISEEKIGRIIDTICEELFPGDPGTMLRAKNLLIGYYSECLDIYSPQRLGHTLETKHAEIERIISGLKKADGSSYSMKDDVVYLIPQGGKSYDTIALQYAKLNGVDPSQFVYMQRTNDKVLKSMIYQQKGKIFVVLDDVVGSGLSMMTQDDGACYCYARPGKDSHVIMSPIVSGETGKSWIDSEIASAVAKGQKDFLLIDSDSVKQPIKETNFYKNLPPEDQGLLLQLLSSAGTCGIEPDCAYAICFPYMAPDNDAAINDLIFRDLMPNAGAIKSKMDYGSKPAGIVSQLDMLDK